MVASRMVLGGSSEVLGGTRRSWEVLGGALMGQNARFDEFYDFQNNLTNLCFLMNLYGFSRFQKFFDELDTNRMYVNALIECVHFVKFERFNEELT